MGDAFSPSLTKFSFWEISNKFKSSIFNKKSSKIILAGHCWVAEHNQYIELPAKDNLENPPLQTIKSYKIALFYRHS